MQNSLLIIFAGGALIFVIAFIISGSLSTRIKGKRFFRALVFFPSVINPVAVAILWTFIYNNNWGLLNGLLRAIGLSGLQRVWTNPEYLFWSILVALVWMYMGFFCVLLLAALDRIPTELLESATLEGAGEFLIFFRVKIPLIWDVLVMAITFWGITAVKEFSLLYSFGGGIDAPPDGITNLAVEMYHTAFGKMRFVYRMGYATAMGVIMFLLIVILYLTIHGLAKRESVEY